jgi:branched-chain amino acid transport system permease protein
MPSGWKLSGRQTVAAASILVLLVALLFVPKFRSEYELLTYTRFLILAVMAQGWNFIGGYTGYAAFGNVAFFGIGAYTTGLLMISSWQVPFFPALLCGAILAAILASVIGLPVLRLKGHYFAIATLGVAEAARQIADTWDSVTQGSPPTRTSTSPRATFSSSSTRCR